MAAEGVHALPGRDVPDFAGAVDGAGDAEVGGVVELSRGDLPVVPAERVGDPPVPRVPDLDGVVEAAGDDAAAVGVKVEADDLRRAKRGVSWC